MHCGRDSVPNRTHRATGTAARGSACIRREAPLPYPTNWEGSLSSDESAISLSAYGSVPYSLIEGGPIAIAIPYDDFKLRHTGLTIVLIVTMIVLKVTVH